MSLKYTRHYFHLTFHRISLDNWTVSTDDHIFRLFWSPLNDIALDQDCPIGYIIAGVRDDHVGEIESIFIIKSYRGMGIGGKLMNSCLGWMKSSNVDSIIVKVAAGNEAVYPFYAKYGFFPRVITLKQKPLSAD